jgi:hypothetical protein
LCAIYKPLTICSHPHPNCLVALTCLLKPNNNVEGRSRHRSGGFQPPYAVWRLEAAATGSPFSLRVLAL